MKDIYEIRRDNLRSVIRERSANSVAAACGYAGPSFISQIAGKKPTRPVTEESARKIEKALGLGDYWLDIERDALGNEAGRNYHLQQKVPSPVKVVEPKIPLNIVDPERATACVVAITEALAAGGKKMEREKILKIVGLMVDDYSKEGEALREYAKTLVNLVG